VENIFDTTHSAALQDVIRAAQKIAQSDLTVLIVGEHGTGKEWLARMIHQLNPTRTGPFWPFDCAAIPSKDVEKELYGSEELTQNGIIIQRGAFEESEQGTLLLNEIDSLPAAIQMKVSRTVEFRTIHRVGNDKILPIDVRIIATLSQPADSLIAGGTLSKEMFYRISPIVLELPPLRQHKEDIPFLIEKFLTDLRVNNKNKSTLTGISQEAMLACLKYDWPGNVRHLKNALEYAFIMCTGSLIELDHFPAYLRDNLQEKHHPLLAHPTKKTA
jgi:two-component system, NtrC family, response regulator HydG